MATDAVTTRHCVSVNSAALYVTYHQLFFRSHRDRSSDLLLLAQSDHRVGHPRAPGGDKRSEESSPFKGRPPSPSACKYLECAIPHVWRKW